jgi:hypothetical protein
MTKKAVPHQGSDWEREPSLVERPNPAAKAKAEPGTTPTEQSRTERSGTEQAVTGPAPAPFGHEGGGRAAPAPLAISPLEYEAQLVAEQYRDRLRRTRGLEEYLSYIRSAFMAGIQFAASGTIFDSRPAYQGLEVQSTYQPDDRYGETVIH